MKKIVRSAMLLVALLGTQAMAAEVKFATEATFFDERGLPPT